MARAAALLRAGEAVGLPTETVYGLAANALDGQAVERVFEIKGRPARNPVIVHVASREMAELCVTGWPPLADRLARAFWPGPLTLVLPRSKRIPDIVTAGGSTVGVRWPRHPFMQAVIRECGFPLAAPSANPSNRVSPTTARHVAEDLGERIRLIVDGGQSEVGIESTVLDLTADPPRMLRPGMIGREALRECAIRLDEGGTEENAEGELRSPGRLPRHYSPKARLGMLSWRDEADLRAQLARGGWDPEKTQILAHTVVPSGGVAGRVVTIARDAAAFARAIYAELRRCDETGAEWIFVEALPETDEWQAIADRLKHAAA